MAQDILSERLLLREWRSDDLDRLVEIFARPEVWRFPFGRGFTAEETERFLKRQIRHQEIRGWGERAAVLRESGDLIGYVGITLPEWLPEAMPTPEIGWRLDPDSWGAGLATEGARVALEHGFIELGFDEVVAIYEPENVASGRVMEKLGMRFDRDTVDPARGIPLRFYRISRSEWSERS